MEIIYEGRRVDLWGLVREIMRPDRLPLYDPWFPRYHRWLGEDQKLENYIHYLRVLLRQAGFELRGRRILDAGCGFGLTALFLHLLGAEEVHGLDCHAGMIQTFHTYLAFLPFPVRVYPRQGDVAQMPYENASFDLILSIEAISHYRQVEAFLAEAGRLLRPGGTLIIVDGNNIRHRSTLLKTRQIWAAFENGPATENIYGHRVEKPFVQMRREMIANAFPHLADCELDDLSRETTGLAGDEVLAAVREYLQMGRRPGRRWDGMTCPLDPAHGYYIERLLDPFALADEARRVGFQVVVRPYFGGARGGIVQWANEVLSQPALAPLMLRFTPAFRIFGRLKK